jgi:hypothetical protein
VRTTIDGETVVCTSDWGLKREVGVETLTLLECPVRNPTCLVGGAAGDCLAGRSSSLGALDVMSSSSVTNDINLLARETTEDSASVAIPSRWATCFGVSQATSGTVSGTVASVRRGRIGKYSRIDFMPVTDMHFSNRSCLASFRVGDVLFRRDLRESSFIEGGSGNLY